MQHIVPTATASSTLADQAISASLTVEVMTDLDDGQPTLVASTQGNQGDLQVVTVAQALAKVTALREQAGRIEALVNEYAATVVIPAFLAEFGIELEELDLAGLDKDALGLASKLHAVAGAMSDGTFRVAVPAGQAPVERLAAIRSVVLYLQKRGQA